MPAIKVMIVDDHRVVREGLRSMLQLDPAIEVVGEADCGEKALKEVERLSPDVILMDAKMPDMSGIEATRLLKERGCNAKIVILTGYEDKYLTQAAEAGASGYLVKAISQEELVNAVKSAYYGKSPLSPEVTQSLFHTFATFSRLNRNNLLTPRQLEILRLIAAGATNKQISQKLFVSEATVKRETNAIFEKLDAADRAQAVAEAYRRNIL